MLNQDNREQVTINGTLVVSLANTQLINLSIKALRNLYSPAGFNVGLNLGAVAGAGIYDHVHYHVVPRWTGDTNFMPVIGKTKIISQDLKIGYEKIKAEMLKLLTV